MPGELVGVRELRRTRVGREFSERDAFKACKDDSKRKEYPLK